MWNRIIALSFIIPTLAGCLFTKDSRRELAKAVNSNNPAAIERIINNCVDPLTLLKTEDPVISFYIPETDLSVVEMLIHYGVNFTAIIDCADPEKKPAYTDMEEFIYIADYLQYDTETRKTRRPIIEYFEIIGIDSGGFQNDLEIIELLANSFCDVSIEFEDNDIKKITVNFSWINNINRSLVHQAQEGNYSDVIELLELGADPNYICEEVDYLGNIHRTNALAGAIIHDNGEIVAALLDTGAFVYHPTMQTNSLFYTAVEKGSIDSVSVFIDKGYLSRDYINPGNLLIAGVQNDQYEILELLLEEGVNIDSLADTPSGDPVNALYMAIQEENPRMIEFLLNHNASLASIKNDRYSVIDLVLEVDQLNANHRDFLLDLLESDIATSDLAEGNLMEYLISKPLLEDKTLLQFHLENSDLETLNQFIDSIRNKDMESILTSVVPEGESLLHWAAKSRDSVLVKLLLISGANPNLKDELGQSVFSLAYDDIEIVQLFLDFGINPFALKTEAEKYEVPEAVLTAINRQIDLVGLSVNKDFSLRVIAPEGVTLWDSPSSFLDAFPHSFDNSYQPIDEGSGYLGKIEPQSILWQIEETQKEYFFLADEAAIVSSGYLIKVAQGQLEGWVFSGGLEEIPDTFIIPDDLNNGN